MSLTSCEARLSQTWSIPSGLLCRLRNDRCAPRRLQGVRWTSYALWSSIQNVRVYHRCFHILLAKQLLHCADVAVKFKHVLGKGVTEGVPGLR